MNPEISVLINVYNGEKYIYETIKSLQMQTFSNFEIIVVDDGSQDDTYKIVKQMMAYDPRIHVFKLKNNYGIPYAQNFGLKYCMSPYIAKTDGDDISLPQRLEKQLEFLKSHNTIDLVGCATRSIDEDGHFLPGYGISIKPISVKQVNCTYLVANPCLHVWMARRRVYDALRGYRNLAYAEDYDFVLRALTSGFAVTNLKDVLMHIRTHSGQTSELLEPRKSHYYVIKLCKERINNNGIDSFNEDKYKLAIRCGTWENRLFKVSQIFLRYALKRKNTLCRIIIMCVSSAASKWQTKYYIDKIKYRIEIFKIGK